MKRTTTKLVLEKTTVRILTNTALRTVAAGINATQGQGQSCVASCLSM